MEQFTEEEKKIAENIIKILPDIPHSKITDQSAKKELIDLKQNPKNIANFNINDQIGNFNGSTSIGRLNYSNNGNNSLGIVNVISENVEGNFESLQISDQSPLSHNNSSSLISNNMARIDDIWIASICGELVRISSDEKRKLILAYAISYIETNLE